MIPFSFGGNKARIAGEFLCDMRLQEKNCMVGYGNARSNLVRALSNLCYMQGIPCHIIAPADDNGDRIETFNEKLAKQCNAIFHYCNKNDVRNTVECVLQELLEKGLKPYYIYGDSYGKGNEATPLRAYRKVYEKISNRYDYIFVPLGTGMTMGGLIAGKAALNGNEIIIGVSVAREKEKATDVLMGFLREYSGQIEKIIWTKNDIRILDDYLCGGYGKYNRQIACTIDEMYTKHGIPLDPTYTGKAFYGMTEYLKKEHITGKKILFMHTGGTPLFFDYIAGEKLVELTTMEEVEDAIRHLESNLPIPLSQQGIDITEYAAKISRYGKAWGHLNGSEMISMIAGYCNDLKGGTAYITLLAVDAPFQEKKLGAKLMDLFEENAAREGMRAIKLEVKKSNVRAQKFYSRRGYTILGEASDVSIHMLKHLEEHQL